MNDVHEWILEKNGKKTVVRCETQPYESLGMKPTDSLSCELYDYKEGEKISTYHGDVARHHAGSIQIAIDFIQLSSRRK
jgi:hypothetical protein